MESVLGPSHCQPLPSSFHTCVTTITLDLILSDFLENTSILLNTNIM